MSLLASLTNSSDSLSAFDRALMVTQNNVTNASTTDYATQRLDLSAKPFDPAHGLLGGVEAGAIESSRNEFAEGAVSRAQTSLGGVTQQASDLTAVQDTLNLSGANGIPATLANLFQSFSAWSQDPAGAASRQAVIDSAQQLVTSFHATVSGLQQAGADTDRQIVQTVDQINAYARQIQTYNLQMKNGDQHDPSVDAKIHATLENLSQLVNVAWTVGADGSVNVMLDGQTPLVVGDHQFDLSSRIAASADLAPGSPPVPPSAVILDSAGRDITAQATGGQLGALLDTHNQVLASLLGDANQPGGLNQLAQAIADRVNQLLSAGNISDGPPPVTGAPLFSYDTTNATNTAASLALDPAITPDQLAAIDPGPPYVSNGIALKLSALANPQDPADEINNLSYTNFFGSLATAVGRQLSAAQDQQGVQQQALAQAQQLRQQISGVSLDEQAAMVIQFERSYQANAQLFTVLNSLTETLVNLVR